MALVSLLQLDGVSMRYGAVEALTEVSLAVAPAEVVGLCGDNGAGKSTLSKIVAGAEQPVAGEIRLEGRAVRHGGPRDALARGIATIYQDLALAPRLSIYQNLFLGSELTRRVAALRLLDKRAMRAAATEYLGRLRIDMPSPDTEVARLSGGQRQAVAIARALRWNARLIVMDEPTAALGVRETARVLDLVRQLKAEGVAVLMVSHNMEQVVATCDRVVVLRRGRKVADRPTEGLTAGALSHLVLTGGEA